MFDKVEDRLSKIPGERGNILQEKFSAIKRRNPDLKQLEDIRDMLEKNRYMPDMRDYKNLTHLPVHTADIERTFSVYDSMITKRRGASMTNDNVQKHVIAHCYYTRSNPKPLGIWDPMLQNQ